MFKAFIKTDEHENSEVIDNLTTRLSFQNIKCIQTSLGPSEILDFKPFLYFRHPYLRLSDELKLLKFHHDNPSIPRILTTDKELVSINPLSNGIADFIVNQTTSLFKPSIPPLPIFLGTNRRPDYLKLTVNSLIYHLEPEQKLYLLLTDPDEETVRISKNFLQTYPQIEIALVKENLKYSVGNFGSKFFGLEKFLNFEDDVLLPESLSYKLPFWGRQLNYRSSTSDLLSFYISQDNNTADFYKSSMHYLSNGMLKVPSSVLWHYTQKDSKWMFPIGGMGTVIDSPRMQVSFEKPYFHKTDAQFYKNSRIICVCNVPILHLGSNQKMDYRQYVETKKNFKVERFQVGINLRTGESKLVDLSKDWSQHR